MSNSTSAGLPTIGEMVEFINNQELTLKIEDHVSMTGKNHRNLVVYFKPFHGKYYNWIRRYNGASSSPRTKNDHPGQNRIYLQIERRKSKSDGLDHLYSHSIYGCFKQGHTLKRYSKTIINLKRDTGMKRRQSFVVYRSYNTDDRQNGKFAMCNFANPNRLQSVGRGFGKTVFLLRPQDAAKGYFVLRQDVIILPNKSYFEEIKQTLYGLNIAYKSTTQYNENGELETTISIMRMINGMRIRMEMNPSNSHMLLMGVATSNVISRNGNILNKK